MAEQNKDETKPIASGLQPGPTEHLAVTSPQATTGTGAMNASGTGTGTGSSASSSYGSTSGVSGASSMTGNSGTTTGTMAAKASQAVKQNTARLTEEAKHYAGDMANMAKEKSRTVFQQQKETAVGKVDSMAQAFRTTAQNLQGDQQQAQIGHYIEMAADKLESFGAQLRQKDLDTLISDTQNLARRSPAAFFAGTVVAGFLLSRFLKSSSERMRESSADSFDDRSSYPATDTGISGTYTAQSGATGSTSADVSSAYRSSSASGTGATTTERSFDSTTGASGLGTGSTGSTGAGLSSSSSSTLSDSSNKGDTYGPR